MRTIGYNRTVTWDSSSKSYDPDTLGLGRTALSHKWFCRNYTDEELVTFESITYYSKFLFILISVFIYCLDLNHSNPEVVFLISAS